MSIDLPGFADPVLGSQACFRAVLDAMARPGTFRNAGAGLAPPAPLMPAAAAVLLTLVDAETPFHLSPASRRCRTGSAFIAARYPSTPPALRRSCSPIHCPTSPRCKPAPTKSPDASATLILQVAALDTGRRLRLSGPGLRVPVSVEVTGLPDNFAALWAANHALYPRGIDILLCSGTRLAALPRSVRVEG